MVQWNYRDFAVLIRRSSDDEPVAEVQITAALSPKHVVPVAMYAIDLLNQPGAEHEGVMLFAEVRHAETPDAGPLLSCAPAYGPSLEDMTPLVWTPPASRPYEDHSKEIV